MYINIHIYTHTQINKYADTPIQRNIKITKHIYTTYLNTSIHK